MPQVSRRRSTFPDSPGTAAALLKSGKWRFEAGSIVPVVMTPSGMRVATKSCRRIQACSEGRPAPRQEQKPDPRIYHISLLSSAMSESPPSQSRMTSSHCRRQEFQMHVAFGIFLDDGLAFLDS